MNFSKIIKTRLSKLNNSNKTLADIFRLIHDQNDKLFCEEVSNRVFVEEVSYWEIKRLSLNLASHLSKQYNNVRIGIQMRNSYLFVVVLWGIILSGNIPVLINVELSSSQIEKVIKDLNVKYVIDYNLAQQLKTDLKHQLPLPNFDYSSATNEIILMTMGTTGNLKFSSFSGEKVAAFINKTPYIVKKIPKMLSKKDIKHIALLPLYHVFGLFTVYFWFSYFGMPFLFVDNITQDLLENIRRFKVTHIFGVPAFFNIVAENILKEVEKQNKLDEFREGIEKSIKIQTKFPNLNRYFIRRKFDAIINKTLGYQIAFLISGGASISKETLEVFNGIGYDLITGYGTTEIGITSINLSNKASERIIPNIGVPLPNVEYVINEYKILEVKADTQADNVYGYFVTNDHVFKTGDFYSFIARSDELVTLNNGENYNINYLQSLNYHFEVIKQYCFLPLNGNLVFLFSINGMNQEEVPIAKREIRENKILRENKITKIMFTESPLRIGLKMINYREILSDIKSENIIVKNLFELNEVSKTLIKESDYIALQVEKIITNVLGISKPIANEVDIFFELGCTSFEYALIVNDISNYFKLEPNYCSSEGVPLVMRSINDFVKCINKKKGN